MERVPFRDSGGGGRDTGSVDEQDIESDVEPTVEPTPIVESDEGRADDPEPTDNQLTVDEICPHCKTISIRYSYYQPWKGGPNCARFVNGECISNMASGRPWKSYVDKAIACPRSWPFGTKLYAFGQEWTCLDRGGAINYVNGVPWIDFLASNPHMAFGSVFEVEAEQ